MPVCAIEEATMAVITPDRGHRVREGRQSLPNAPQALLEVADGI
jgi:hypothetical protein